MLHVHFISGGNSLRLKGLVHPMKDELDLGLSTGVSAGGELYVSQKASSTLTLVRSFAGVHDEGYEALKNWFASVSQGSRNPFTFIDADGLSYTVRWTDSLLGWQRDADNRWSGTLNLRVEGYEP
jgi:hypothetical protein